MTTRILELPGMRVETIVFDNAHVIVSFSTAHIIKSMDDAVEKTLWRQGGSLRIYQAEVSGDPPDLPANVEHADINDNTYTQRDMIQIPLHSTGRVGCELKFEGHTQPLCIMGEEIHLILEKEPKYIRHLPASGS